MINRTITAQMRFVCSVRFRCAVLLSGFFFTWYPKDEEEWHGIVSENGDDHDNDACASMAVLDVQDQLHDLQVGWRGFSYLDSAS